MRADAMLSSERVSALQDILNIRSGGCQLRNNPRLITLVPIPAENFPAMPVRCKQVHSPQSHPLPSHPCCSHPSVQLSEMRMAGMKTKQGANTPAAHFPWCQHQLGSLGISVQATTEGGILEAVGTIPRELPAPESLNASTNATLGFVVRAAVRGVSAAWQSKPRERGHGSRGKLLHGPVRVPRRDAGSALPQHPPPPPWHFPSPDPARVLRSGVFPISSPACL